VTTMITIVASRSLFRLLTRITLLHRIQRVRSILAVYQQSMFNLYLGQAEGVLR